MTPNLQVEHYHSHLVEELGTRGAAPSLANFRLQYTLAFLDLTRVVLADHWKIVGLETLRSRRAMPDSKKKVLIA